MRVTHCCLNAKTTVASVFPASAGSLGGSRNSARLHSVEPGLPDQPMKDPYEILGVAKTATADEIRNAYRKLAKKLHPDLNPGDKRAEEQFKEVAAANDLLSDPDKRRRFDAGEIDASGAEKAPPHARYYRDYAGGSRPPLRGTRRLRRFRAGRRHVRRASAPRRRTGAAPARRRPALRASGRISRRGQRRDQDDHPAAGGANLEVTIPAGVEDGQILRLRGKGAPSPGEGAARRRAGADRRQAASLFHPRRATTSFSTCRSR